MEQETVLTGYCRRLDASRMVLVCLEDSRLTEIDCDYPDCPYAPGCPIAAKIQKITE